jgi:hypothetical protein
MIDPFCICMYARSSTRKQPLSVAAREKLLAQACFRSLQHADLCLYGISECSFYCVIGMSTAVLRSIRSKQDGIACWLASPAMMEWMRTVCVLNHAAESRPLCVVKTFVEHQRSWFFLECIV